MENQPIQIGDLVTISPEYSKNYSNSYIVGYIINDIALVFHPMRPTIFISKELKKLNKTFPVKLNPYENLVSYVEANKHYLSFLDVQEFESVVYYMLINKNLTSRHKATLSKFVEIIARIDCTEDLLNAYKICIDNAAILIDDPFNYKFYKSHISYMKNGNTAVSKKQEKCIYRMAGFVLAQKGRK